MMCTSQKNNLYDSVINEVEKIEDWQKKLKKFSHEDFLMIRDANFDVDLMGFVHFRTQEIISDRLLRSFVNIKIAIERCYTSLEKELASPEITTVLYSKKVFNRIYEIADDLINKRERRKLYDREMNSELNESTFIAYCEKVDIEFNEYISTIIPYQEEVSIEEFKHIMDRFYAKIRSFMNVMRCELESRPSLDFSSVVMKHVYHVVLISASAVSTLKMK